MSLEAAICTEPNTATTSKILSSNEGARKISPSLVPPQKLIPPMKLEMLTLQKSKAREVNPHTLPRYVQYHDPLQARKGNPLAVALQLHPLLQVLVGLLEPLFAAQDAVPHVILGPGSAFLRVLLPFVVEIERYLGVDADAEIIVHDAALVEAFGEGLVGVYQRADGGA